MHIFIIFAVIALIIIFVVAVRNKNGKNDSGSNETIEFRPLVLDEKKPSTTIHYSDDFKGEKPVVTKEGTHTTMTLLMFIEDSSIWVCSSCETENTESASQCEVCGCRR